MNNKTHTLQGHYFCTNTLGFDAAVAGKAVNQTVSHIPVFIPKSNDEGNK